MGLALVGIVRAVLSGLLNWKLVGAARQCVLCFAGTLWLRLYGFASSCLVIKIWHRCLMLSLVQGRWKEVVDNFQSVFLHSYFYVRTLLHTHMLRTHIMLIYTQRGSLASIM